MTERTQRAVTLVTGLVAVTIGALPAQSRVAKPVIDTVSGHIVRVMNSGPTAWTDTNGWKLVYERSIQPKDGTPGELGNPTAVVLLDDGRLVETETNAPPIIRLFDATGRFVRNISRSGDGPGEFRNPNPMLIRDTLVIHDPRLHRATLFTLDGKRVRSVESVCCSVGSPYWIDGRGRMFLQGLGRGPGGQSVVVDVNGKRLDSLSPPIAAPPHTWTVLNANGQPSLSVGIPYTGQTVRTILHDGSVLYGATSNYQFVVSSNGRDTTRIFGRSDLKEVPLRAALRDSMFRFLVDKLDGIRAVAHESDVPTTFPLWSGVTQDGSGNVWIERGAANGVPGQFDVFASDGRFLGNVPAPLSGRVAAWNRDHLAVIDTDASNLPRIRIYRIDRRGH